MSGKALGQPLAILVVDDEPCVARVLLRRLSQDGHEVACVASGEEALRLAGLRSFDFALVDLVLPGLSGHAVIEKLAALARYPVVAMSGRCDPEVRADVRLLGAVDMLEKPIDFERLSILLGGGSPETAL